MTSALEQSPWPTAAEKERCFRVWNAASPEERQRMVRLQGHGVARRIRIAQALLKIKAAKFLDVAFDVETPEKLLLPLKLCDGVPSEAGLEHLCFNPDFTLAELTPEFCAHEDCLTTMLEKAVKTQAAHIDVMQKMADSYLAFASSDGYRLDAASASWEALATNVFTLLITAILMRCSDDLSTQKAFLKSMSLPSQVKLRSWPSKKQLEMLRETWGSRTDQERGLLTVLCGPRMWWVHNCDYILSVREVRDYITIFLPRTCTLKTTEDEAACKRRLDACRRGVGLEHFAGLEDNWGAERMFFTKEFFQQPRSLDRILKHAVPQLSSRCELVKLVDAATCPFELSSAAYRLIGENHLVPMPTWQGLATVVYTLVLDAILVRCENHRALEAAMKQRMLLKREEENQRTVMRRQTKAKRKRQGPLLDDAGEIGKAPHMPSENKAMPGTSHGDELSELGEAAEDSSFPSEALMPGDPKEIRGKPSRETYFGRWCDVELPFCQWFVRNTFVDIDLPEDTDDLMPVPRSLSCPS